MGERRVFPHSPWIIDKHFRDAYEEINDAQTVHMHVHVHGWTVLDYENKEVRRAVLNPKKLDDTTQRDPLAPVQYLSFLLSYS